MAIYEEENNIEQQESINKSIDWSNAAWKYFKSEINITQGLHKEQAAKDFYDNIETGREILRGNISESSYYGNFDKTKDVENLNFINKYVNDEEFRSEQDKIFNDKWVEEEEIRLQAIQDRKDADEIVSEYKDSAIFRLSAFVPGAVLGDPQNLVSEVAETATKAGISIATANPALGWTAGEAVGAYLDFKTGLTREAFIQDKTVEELSAEEKAGIALGTVGTRAVLGVAPIIGKKAYKGIRSRFDIVKYANRVDDAVGADTYIKGLREGAVINDNVVELNDIKKIDFTQNEVVNRVDYDKAKDPYLKELDKLDNPNSVWEDEAIIDEPIVNYDELSKSVKESGEDLGQLQGHKDLDVLSRDTVSNTTDKLEDVEAINKEIISRGQNRLDGKIGFEIRKLAEYYSGFAKEGGEKARISQDAFAINARRFTTDVISTPHKTWKNTIESEFLDRVDKIAVEEYGNGIKSFYDITKKFDEVEPKSLAKYLSENYDTPIGLVDSKVAKHFKDTYDNVSGLRKTYDSKINTSIDDFIIDKKRLRFLPNLNERVDAFIESGKIKLDPQLPKESKEAIVENLRKYGDEMSDALRERKYQHYFVNKEAEDEFLEEFLFVNEDIMGKINGTNSSIKADFKIFGAPIQDAKITKIINNAVDGKTNEIWKKVLNEGDVSGKAFTDAHDYVTRAYKDDMNEVISNMIAGRTMKSDLTGLSRAANIFSSATSFEIMAGRGIRELPLNYITSTLRARRYLDIAEQNKNFVRKLNTLFQIPDKEVANDIRLFQKNMVEELFELKGTGNVFAQRSLDDIKGSTAKESAHIIASKLNESGYIINKWSDQLRSRLDMLQTNDIFKIMESRTYEGIPNKLKTILNRLKIEDNAELSKFQKAIREATNENGFVVPSKLRAINDDYYETYATVFNNIFDITSEDKAFTSYNRNRWRVIDEIKHKFQSYNKGFIASNSDDFITRANQNGIYVKGQKRKNFADMWFYTATSGVLLSQTSDIINEFCYQGRTLNEVIAKRQAQLTVFFDKDTSWKDRLESGTSVILGSLASTIGISTLFSVFDSKEYVERKTKGLVKAWELANDEYSSKSEASFQLLKGILQAATPDVLQSLGNKFRRLYTEIDVKDYIREENKWLKGLSPEERIVAKNLKDEYGNLAWFGFEKIKEIIKSDEQVFTMRRAYEISIANDALALNEELPKEEKYENRWRTDLEGIRMNDKPVAELFEKYFELYNVSPEQKGQIIAEYVSQPELSKENKRGLIASLIGEEAIINIANNTEGKKYKIDYETSLAAHKVSEVTGIPYSFIDQTMAYNKGGNTLINLDKEVYEKYGIEVKEDLRNSEYNIKLFGILMYKLTSEQGMTLEEATDEIFGRNAYNEIIEL